MEETLNWTLLSGAAEEEGAGRFHPPADEEEVEEEVDAVGPAVSEEELFDLAAGWPRARVEF